MLSTKPAPKASHLIELLKRNGIPRENRNLAQGALLHLSEDMETHWTSPTAWICPDAQSALSHLRGTLSAAQLADTSGRFSYCLRRRWDNSQEYAERRPPDQQQGASAAMRAALDVLNPHGVHAVFRAALGSPDGGMLAEWNPMAVLVDSYDRRRGLAANTVCSTAAWAAQAISRIDTWERIGGVSAEIAARVDEAFVQFYLSGMLAFWPVPNGMLFVPLPKMHVVDGRLHREDGPAAYWPTGEKYYFFRGLHVPDRLIEERDQIKPHTILAERNAELRRVMLELYGLGRWIDEIGAVVVAEDVSHGQPRRIYEVDFLGERLRVLHVVNGSLEPDGTRREFFLHTSSMADTPHEAVALSYGINPKLYAEFDRS